MVTVIWFYHTNSKIGGKINMANRQYVGARYVPKYFENPDGSNTWLNGISYEALTIVTYANNTFTSKIPVPSNIGAPNDNPKYWVNTGTGGGGGSEINELKEKVENIENEIVDINNSITSINGSIANIEETINSLSEYNAIYVGNSYTQGIGSTGNKGIYELTKNFFSKTYAFYGTTGKGGEGFATYTNHQETFYNILQTHSSELTESEKTKITHIIFISAMGDSRWRKENENELTDTYEPFLTQVRDYIKTNYPNAQMYIYFPEMISTNNTTGASCDFQNELWVHYMYRKLCNKNNIVYLGWGGWFGTLKTTYLSNDGYHPNDKGYEILSSNLISALKGNFKEPVRSEQAVSQYGGNTICVGTPDSIKIILPTLTNNQSMTATDLILITKDQNLIIPYGGPALNGIIRDTDNNPHYGGIKTDGNTIKLSTNVDFTMPRQNYFMSSSIITTFFY